MRLSKLNLKTVCYDMFDESSTSRSISSVDTVVTRTDQVGRAPRYGTWLVGCPTPGIELIGRIAEGG